MAYENYGPLILQLAKEQQAKNEASARARTFNVGNIVPGIASAVLTGGATLPALLAGAGLGAAGEGIRAATGSDVNIAAELQKIPGAIENYNMINQFKDKIGTDYLPSKFTLGGVEFAPSLAMQYGQLMGLGGNGSTGTPVLPAGWVRLVDHTNPKKSIDFNPKDPQDATLLKVYQGLGWRKI